MAGLHRIAPRARFYSCGAFANHVFGGSPAASSHLTGDNLLCVDFSSIADQTLTTPPPSQLAGWNFEKFDKSCWQILAGTLQVKMFSVFASSCGFLMPALTAGDYQKYNSFTLAVVQTVDLNTSKQGAYIYLGRDVPEQQIWYTTGTYPKMVSTLRITKDASIPNGGSNIYQPLFKITSGVMAGSTAQGWQIESIAVMGNP